MHLPLVALRKQLACPSLDARVERAWKASFVSSETSDSAEISDSSESSSSASSHRLAVRRALVETLRASGTAIDAAAESALIDLSAPPTTRDWSVSVSHCPEAGGFSVVEKPFAVGLDIEVITRVSAGAAARLSKSEEFLSAPSPWQLWLAKEAAFKAHLGPHQPKVLSAMEVSSWRRHPGTAETPELWTFAAHCLNPKHCAPPDTSGIGAVFEISGLGFGFFVLSLN